MLRCIFREKKLIFTFKVVDFKKEQLLTIPQALTMFNNFVLFSQYRGIERGGKEKRVPLLKARPFQ